MGLPSTVRIPSARIASGSTEPVERIAQALFSHCLDAFRAFAPLSHLAEDMRVLSLNAELAAGRAGARGAAVRALTQYTRELVTRLNDVQHEMNDIKTRVCAHSARTLRLAHQLAIFARAAEALHRVSSTQSSRLAQRSAAQSRDVRFQSIRPDVREAMAGIDRLSGETGRIGDLTVQASTIASNIAIEAATAGPYEEEFKLVSSTMRAYVAELRRMVDEAGQAIREATTSGRNLAG